MRRRRVDILKNFLVGGLQPGYHARHVVLTGGMLDDLPQRGEIERYLMQLLTVEGGGDRRFRREQLWCSLRNGCRWRRVGAGGRTTMVSEAAGFVQPSCSTRGSSAWAAAASRVPGPIICCESRRTSEKASTFRGRVGHQDFLQSKLHYRRSLL